MEEQRTGGRVLLTSLAPRMAWLPLGFGLLLAVIVALTLVALIVGRGDPGRARVLETMPDSADIVVLDGPEPQSWTVTFLDESNAQRGDVVSVRLRGDCRCEPSSDPGSPAALIVGAVFFGLLFIATLRMARKTKHVRAAQLRSLAVAEGGTPAMAVVVRPRFSPGSIRNVRLWLEVLDAGSGRSLGWIDIRRARPGFDAMALGWLIGPPIHGADVALATADGSSWALAAGPLAGEGGPLAAWSSLVVDTLGWNRPAELGVPTVGGDGRLSVGSNPSEVPSALRDVVRSRPAGSALASSRKRILGFYALCLISFFVVPIPWNLVVMLAVIAAFVILATRQQAPVREAVRAAAPELGRRDVNAASAFLLALGGSRDPQPTDDGPPPPAAPSAGPGTAI